MVLQSTQLSETPAETPDQVPHRRRPVSTLPVLTGGHPSRFHPSDTELVAGVSQPTRTQVIETKSGTIFQHKHK